MKTILKTSLALILIMLLSSTFADDTTNTGAIASTESGSSITETGDAEDSSENEDSAEGEASTENEDSTTPTTVSGTGVNNMMRIKNEIRKMKRKDLMKNIKEQRNEMKMEIKANRIEIKNNLQNFRKENGTASGAFANLSDEVKAEIKTLQEEFKASTEALKKEYESEIKSASGFKTKDSLRQELKTKIEEIVIAHHEELKQLVGSDEKALAWIEAREEIAKNNMDIRKANLQVRIKFRGNIESQILAFKEKFHSQLGDKLVKVGTKSPEKLEKILEKIDAMMVKFEANTKISKTDKEKIMSKLTALKELLEDSLDTEGTITTE